MNTKRFFFVMVGVLTLCTALVVASVVLGDLYLHKQAQKLVDLKLDNQVIDQQQVALLQAKKDVQKYADLDNIAKQIIPQDKDQARATREILNIADASGIKLASISFPASTLGQAPPKASTDTSSSTATPVAPVTPTVTQVKPVDGLQNVYQYDITVVSDTAFPVSYNKLIDFLSRLEQNRRTAQVTQIAIQPDAQNRNALNFNLTITLYIKP